MKTKLIPSFALALTFSLTMTGLPGIGKSANLSAGELSPSEKIVETIIKRGFKRVAVLPRVVSRTAGDENPVTGKNTVGALSMAWPDDLYDALIEASGESNGQFQVVSDQQVLPSLHRSDKATYSFLIESFQLF